MKVTNEGRILLDASLIGGGSSDSDSGGEEGYVPGPDCCDDDPVDVAVDGIAYVPGGATTPAYVQVKGAQDTLKTATVALDATPTVGNILVGMIFAREDAGASWDLTANGWTFVRRESTSAADSWPCEMYYRIVQSGDTATWTATTAANGAFGFVVVELAGVSTLGVDVGSSNATTEPTISITPTSTDPIVIVSMASVRKDTDAVFTPASGMTEVLDANYSSGDNGPQAAVNYQVVSAPTGSYTVGSTYGAGSSRAVIAATFRGSVAGYVVAPEVTDADDATYVAVSGGTDVVRIDLGSAQLINRSRLRIASENAGTVTYSIYGSNIGDFSTEVLLSSVTFATLGSYSPQDVAFLWSAATAYRYYRVEGTAENRRIHTWELFPYTLSTGSAGIAADLAAHEADPDDAHPQYLRTTDGGGDVINTVAASGATETLDLVNGNVHVVTLTANCTFTFTSPAAGKARSFRLYLWQDGTGGWTTTWPASVEWASGSAPTLATTAGTLSVLTFETLDGGTIWNGYPIGGGDAGPETPVEHGSMGATETIDVTAGTWHRGTLNADCAITVSGFVAAEGLVVMVGITQDGTGAHAITWDADVVFADGADDQPDQAAAAVTWFMLWSDEGDGTIFGAVVGATATAVAALDDLSDVTITSPAEGHALRYRSGTWVNEVPETNGRWELVVTGSAPPVAMTNDAETDFLYASV